MKDENNHVEIHELRGFVADDLVSPLREVDVISRGTKRTKHYLYSLSLNSPPDENVLTPVFEDAFPSHGLFSNDCKYISALLECM